MSIKKFLDGWVFPLVALAACIMAGVIACWLFLAKSPSDFRIVLSLLVATLILSAVAKHFYKRWDFLIGAALCAGLGAVMGPIVQASRWSDSSENCQGKLSQLQRALMLYTEDHDYRMPLAASWRTSTKKYLETERSLRCSNAVAPYSYGMNDEVSGRSVVDLPADTVVLFECEAYLEDASGGKEWQVHRHEGLEWVATPENVRSARKGKKDVPYIWKP